jgi:hypothetical protein
MRRSTGSSFPGARRNRGSILARGRSDSSPELAGSEVSIPPTDLLRDGSERCVRVPQEERHPLDAEHREVRDRRLSECRGEHAPKLRRRQVCLCREVRQSPPMGDIGSHQGRNPMSFATQCSEGPVAWGGRVNYPSARRSHLYTGRAQVWGDNVQDLRQPRLSPMKCLRAGVFNAEPAEFIEPRTEELGDFLPESEKLRRLRAAGREELFCIEAIAYVVRVLPERHVNQVVLIDVHGGRSDCARRFHPTEHVRGQYDHVTDVDVMAAEVTEHDRRSIADNDQLHAIKCRWRRCGAIRAGARHDRHVLFDGTCSKGRLSPVNACHRSWGTSRTTGRTPAFAAP